MGHSHGPYERLQSALQGLLGRGIRQDRLHGLRSPRPHHPRRQGTRHLLLHLFRRRTYGAEGRPRQAREGAQRLHIPRVHQRHPRRRRVCEGARRRGQLRTRFQHRRLRRSHRLPPRQRDLPESNRRHAEHEEIRRSLRIQRMLSFQEHRGGRRREVPRFFDRARVHLRLVFHLHAARKRCRHQPPRHPRTARVHVPLGAQDARHKADLPPRLLERRAVCQRLHRRRKKLSAHQRGRRC